METFWNPKIPHDFIYSFDFSEDWFEDWRERQNLKSEGTLKKSFDSFCLINSDKPFYTRYLHNK